MKISHFTHFKMDTNELKSIKAGQVMCSLNVGFDDGSGFVAIGACSGSTESECNGYGANLCSTYTQGMGATSCEVVCTA